MKSLLKLDSVSTERLCSSPAASAAAHVAASSTWFSSWVVRPAHMPQVSMQAACTSFFRVVTGSAVGQEPRAVLDAVDRHLDGERDGRRVVIRASRVGVAAVVRVEVVVVVEEGVAADNDHVTAAVAEVVVDGVP